MHIFVHFPNPIERANLCRTIRTWMELSCVSINIVTTETANIGQAPMIVFWDLDSPASPPTLPESSCALFLCSRDPQRAIDSYSFHPTGFLTKPISVNKLWEAMLRCARLWFSSLLRLELLSDRIKIGVPLKNLIWLEGTRRGCLVHTSHHSISAREPLYQLEQRLPQTVFTRCQRSFVVNLAYVQEVTASSLFLTDGTELSLGRSTKAGVLEAYRRFCRLRYGE